MSQGQHRYSAAKINIFTPFRIHTKHRCRVLKPVLAVRRSAKTIAHNHPQGHAFFLRASSIAQTISSNSPICDSGHCVFESDIASSGFGCVSTNKPFMPTAAAARAKGAITSRAPPLCLSRRVFAPNESRQKPPDSRNRAIATTRACQPPNRYSRKKVPRSHNNTSPAPAVRAFSAASAMSTGATNCPFLMLRARPVRRRPQLNLSVCTKSRYL